MDSDMAHSAVPESRIRHVVRSRLERNAVVGSTEVARSVVALEAERVDHRTFEQFRVGRAVRVMTALATVDANCGVFVQEGTAKINVALEAWFLIALCLFHHAGPCRHAPRRRRCSVRVMAIAALNHALIDPVLERHVELRADRSVAGIAEFCLSLCQKRLLSWRCMYGMARGADYICLGVTGTADICPVEIL